ncbi:hypothetical protein ACSTI9_00265, partial [Vibrio parahaemolyticus]
SKKLLDLTSQIADFRDIGQGRLALADDGLTLEFGIARNGQRPMRLDLHDQSYGPAPQPDPALRTPVLETPGLKVTG